MVWFRVDDILPFHERVLDAGNAAMGLWVRAGAWSSGHLSDGFVPRTIARSIGTPSEIRRLVQVGLWLEVEGGFRFHAWAEDGTGAKRQPTRADIEASRKAERERKAAYRKGRREESRQDDDQRPAAVPPGQTEGRPADVRQASGHPVPSRPDPTHDSYVSQSSHLPDRESYPQDDDGGSGQVQEAYWRGLGVTNPDRLKALLVQHVDRPFTDRQTLDTVLGILTKPKTRPRSPQRYIESAIEQSWAEIQQEYDRKPLVDSGIEPPALEGWAS